MTHIEISYLTAQKIRNEEYLESFPEYYALRDAEENGLWHVHQNVFDHVLAVFENLEKEVSNVSPEVDAYLQEKIGNKSREHLLKIATLLHDIAKRETLILVDGKANCPGHEHIAAGQVKHFAKRFDLDELATKHVESIVLHHGFISDILTQVIDKPEKEDYFWAVFGDAVGATTYELLILMHADLNGCDLDETAPSEYSAREQLLVKWLESKQRSL